MKIGFFGTPELGAFCLEELHKHHEVLFAVTPPDKPSGRNKQIVPCPVKRKAADLDIPLLQPDKLVAEDFASANADIFVVAAYGKLIPKSVFSLPKFGTVNLHPSLLPKYRGAAPIPWALINGEKETGLTIQMINERLDAGDIVLQKTLRLNDTINAGELYSAVLQEGAALLLDAIQVLGEGKASLIKQNEDEATFCKKITKETRQINWQASAEEIHNLVRGLSPTPAALTMFRGGEIKILRTAIADIAIGEEQASGRLLVSEKKRLIAVAGKSSSSLLEILELQPAGKKPMTAAAFINGYRLNPNDKFV